MNITRITYVPVSITLLLGLFVSVAGTAFAQDGSDGVSVEARGSAEADIDALDADDDDDGVSDGSEGSQGSAGASGSAGVEAGASADMQTESDAAADGRTEAEARSTKEIDKASPKLIEARAGGESDVSLGAGVELSGRLCAQSGDCDDADEDVRPGRAEGALSVHVSGAEVRGWSAEKKAQVRARLEAISEINSANDFGIETAVAALENENVAEIRSDDEETEVAFDTTMQLFGVIPMEVRAVARAQGDGEARVEYPWYSFLATKTDASAYANIAARLRAAHDVAISVEEEGAPANRRKDASE